MSLLTRAPATAEKDPALPPGRRRATAATSSSVNLLSPWVLDELRVRRLRRRFIVAAVALLLVVAAAWTLLRLDLARSQNDLRDDENVGTSLGTQIADLGEVKVYVNNVRQRTLSVQGRMYSQIGFSTVLRDLEGLLPARTVLDSMVVSLPEDPATLQPGAAATEPVCPGPDPFGARPVVGCIVASGVAASRADVTSLVTALGRSKLFIEPFITDTTAGSDLDVQGIEFTLSVGLDLRTFTGRFVDIDGSGADQAPGDPANGAASQLSTSTLRTGKSR